MKISRILWGVGLIVIALLLLLNAFGITPGLSASIPFWRLLLGILCVVWLMDRLVKLCLPEIFFPMIFLVMLFEGELARALSLPNEEIASVPMFLLIGFLLTVGSSILLPQRLKGTHISKGHHGPTGNSVYYIDCNEAFEESIKTNMGNCEVFFTNVELYNGSGTIHVQSNMGNVVLHVPTDWCVISSIKNNMGSVHISPLEGVQGNKRLYLTGSANMGNIRVKYVHTNNEKMQEE